MAPTGFLSHRLLSPADDFNSPPVAWTAQRTAIIALLVFAGCFLGAISGGMLQFPVVGTAILYAPYAVLCTALLLAPVRIWWVLILASIAGNYLGHIEFEKSVTFVLFAEVANVSRALVAASGMRLLGGKPHLGTLRDAAIYLAYAAVLGPAVGAFIGAADVVLHNRVADYWLVWQAWLLSNTLTALTLMPLLLLVATQGRALFRNASRWRILEGTALLLGLAVVAYLVLTGLQSGVSLPASLYGPMPFLLWAAIRFGPGGTAIALSIIAGMAIHGAFNGRGPFVTQLPADNLLQLQFFLIAVAVPMMFLASMVRQYAQAATALHASQIQYRSVVEDQSELICRFLPDGTYTFANYSYARFFRREPEELLGKRLWMFIPPERHAAARKFLESISPDSPLQSIEHEVQIPGGEIRWFQWTDRGFFDARGRILEFQAVGRDITERKRFEQALKESASQVRMFVQHAPAAVAMFDRDLKYIIYSQRWLKDYNLGDQNLVGRCHYEVFPEVPEHWKAIHRRCLAGAVETCDEDIFVRLDGSVDWIHWEMHPWQHANGTIGGIIMFTEVITERKRAEDEHRQLESQRQTEKALRASEERFRSLADNTPVLIWRSGLRNEAVYFNKPWLDFTGRTLEQELEYGWLESIHPDDRERCQQTCDAAFARREQLIMQFRLRRHDGSYRWILDNGTPHFGPDGEFSGYFGSCVDITERHLAEEALHQAGKRKDEFLAMLGHELRNPLAPIGMAIEIMRTRAMTDDTLIWARDVISRQLRHLTRLVDDLLDVSRITRGKIRLNMTTLDLGRVITQAIETSKPLLVSRKHELTVDVPEAPLPVRGDAVRLAQVISNLLNNSAKYTDTGGRISVTARPDTTHVVVTVADNGMGIPADMLERVFDMFTQVENPADRSFGGLGIGLTLVKRLLDMHGGTIEARSPGTGKGCEFVMRLPLAIDAIFDGLADPSRDQAGEHAVALAASHTLRPPPHAVHSSNSALQPALPHTANAPANRLVHRRILIVDDNVDAADALSRMLQLEDHEVMVAHDGIAALSAAERMHPDIVLLDIGLPKLDGLEVARRIRQRPDGAFPLLVATTGFGQPEDRRRIAAAGFDHHLVKPLDPNVLHTLVQNGKRR